MKTLPKCMLLVPFFVPATGVCGDALWHRRDPNLALLIQDTRARRVGDLLTVVISEATEFEGMEKRELNKETNTSAGYKFSGKTLSGALARSFSANAEGSGVSQRKFDGKNNSSIDRKFVDRMTVVVVAVMPNGNLVVEGTRQRLLQREMRTLQISGIVRPNDIDVGNVVQSQYIGDFAMNYMGRGPESSYTNHGWWGRVLNVVWPY